MPEPVPDPQFAHVPFQTGGRLLILSTCNQCGCSNVVSAYDGSLERWQDGHQCEKAASGATDA